MSVGALVGTLLGPSVTWLKNTFVFHPNVRAETSPAAYGLPYEEVWFGGPDGCTLHGWYIPSAGPIGPGQEPLFIWFHGNAGNVGHRLSHLRVLYDHVGGSHFLFDYQGYGKSRGKPSMRHEHGCPLLAQRGVGADDGFTAGLCHGCVSLHDDYL